MHVICLAHTIPYPAKHFIVYERLNINLLFQHVRASVRTEGILSVAVLTYSSVI